MSSSRAVDSGLVTKMAHPVAGTVDVMASPYRFNGERLPVRTAPPTLGEGTNAVLADLLGLSEETLKGLKERGVV
jgi:crotonobetainyl-CoA:carnitine CoA-transferase CaiB-like acyl-CoA transferase